MSSVEYLVQRNVPAAKEPGGPATTLIAMVQVRLPDGGLTQIAIREDGLRFECSGDPSKEDAFVRRRIRETVLAEFPGPILQ